MHSSLFLYLGCCRSQRLFQRHVAPVLENAAGMTLTAVLTRHPRHATEITRELDLSTQDILVFVGGDGTVFEGLQVWLPDVAIDSALPVICT